MARDIEANATINDQSKRGLDSFSRNVQDAGKKTRREFDRFGKDAGDNFIKRIGSVSPKLANKIADSLGDGARLGAPLLVSGVSAGLIAGLPIISGLIGAAVTGGAAGAGIVGGVAIAARDSRVKEAGAQLGANLLSGLQDRAGSFVQPVLASIDLLEAKFVESGDTLESIFQNSSKFVAPLADSVGELLQDVASGIDTAVGRAGPVMDALNQGIEEVGESLKSFFDSMSENGEANALVLSRSLSSLASSLEVIGVTLSGVTQAFAALDKVMPLDGVFGLKRRFDELNDSGRRSQGGTFAAADGALRVGTSAEVAETALGLYNKALEDNAAAAQRSLDAQQGLFSATTAYGAALDQAKRAAKDNGETLSANTKKGRENRGALDALASAYKRVVAEQTATGGSSTALAAKQTQLRAQVLAVAVSMTKSKTEANRLTNALLGIPSPKPKVTLNTANVASQARNAREEINQIKGKTVTVTVNVNANRLAKVNAQLERLERGGAFGGMGGGFAAAGGDIRSRVGGAATIEVAQSLAVNLDGRPFREMTARTVADSRDRERYRNRVGKRVDAS